MGEIWTVFKKEGLDTLRDRRTLITSIVIPLVMFPLLMYLAVKVQVGQFEEAADRVLNVGIVADEQPEDFRALLQNDRGIGEIVELEIDEIRTALTGGDLDGVYLFSKDFSSAVSGNADTAYVNLYYRASGIDVARERLVDLIEEFRENKRDERFQRLNVTRGQLVVVEVGQRDISTARERFAEFAGGLIPYFFILISFMGCMYPALDLGAGEKERGTLETLLSTPASRFNILVGKFGIIALVGLVAAILSIAGLGVAVWLFSGELAPRLLDAVLEILEWKTLALMVGLLIPINVLFAGCQLSLSIYAKNVKEAQSLISPALFIVIIPAFMGLIPGFELNPVTALLPLFNVSLSTKAILAGNVSFFLIAEVFVSMILLAIVALYFSTWWFKREQTLFRS